MASVRYVYACDCTTGYHSGQIGALGHRSPFLDAYQRLRSLAARDLAALPALEAACTIVTLGSPAQHVDVWGSAYLTDRIVDATLDGVRQSMSRVQSTSFTVDVAFSFTVDVAFDSRHTTHR